MITDSFIFIRFTSDITTGDVITFGVDYLQLTKKFT